MLFGRGSVFANGASSLGLGPVAGLGLLVTLTAALVGGVLRQQVNVHHVLLMAVAYGVAFVPTERVVVENLYAMDGGPAAVAPVDGVPIAIAYTAAFASGLSREVTEELETAFSGVDGQESVLTRDGFARPLRLAQGLRQIGQRAGPLLGADYVATLSSYGRYCTHDSNGNSLNYVELGRSAAVLDYLASSPVQGYSQVWDARPPYSAPYPGPSLVRTCRETAQWLRERGVQWLGSQSDDGLAFKLGVAVGAKPDCGSQCRLSPMDVDDALEQAMGNLPLSRAQILQNIVFAPLVMQALKLGSAQSADTAYTIGLQESGARESGPGSMFRGTITYAMNICTFLFVAFAPVMAVVMLLLGLQGIQLLARYLLFGVWVYSWLPGAAIVNAYVQLSMREQLANLAHGTADPMALFTPEALRDFHAQVDAMLGMADTLFTATPMITMMLLTGSLYGMAQLAQRAGGMMAAGMSTSGASEGAAAPQAASGGMSSPALLAPPPMSAGLGGLGGGLAGGGLLAGMSAALARRRGGASAVGASTTGWDEGGGAREADNGSAGSALASGGRVQGGGGALELARQFQRQGHGGSGQSALSAVRGMIGRRASGAEAERLEQQLASSERQAKAMGGGASEALELFAQKLDGALGRGDGGAGARAVLEEMAQAAGYSALQRSQPEHAQQAQAAKADVQLGSLHRRSEQQEMKGSFSGESLGSQPAGMDSQGLISNESAELNSRQRTDRVFSRPNLMNLPGWHFQGEGSEELKQAMSILQGSRDALTGKWEPSKGLELERALQQVAHARGLPIEEMASNYSKFVGLFRGAEDRATQRGDFQTGPFREDEKGEARVPLLSMRKSGSIPDNSYHMASNNQLRFGKMVGDAMGLDPVFGALLSPTGGIAGPGNKEIGNAVYAAGGGREVVTNHGIAHDAAGYLFNYHGRGPGYHYVPNNPVQILDKGNPLAGQVDGLAFFLNLNNTGDPDSSIRRNGNRK
ncbi:conjugal transfer protein TraG N-terminal domain-containing protein [Chromobacterium sp. IIBBL 290-4]|nr:conjugal transfer protein TraG N-terminal domain-containing protein [Chromobacterium sp. IIBBL 290-4]UTH76819.1 conjugal transfer protein TraG N-terminal domain-containing protein [Chromobacterium sp. IIBBL 290-4]